MIAANVVHASYEYGFEKLFNLETSHVLPALIQKIHEAKVNGGPVTLWGDGSPRREFLYSDDLAKAVVFLMENYSYKDIGEFVNIGVGSDLTIKQLAELIAKVVGYNGEFVWDTSKPNGTPQKLLNVSRINALRWKAKTSLEEGLGRTYRWFLESVEEK